MTKIKYIVFIGIFSFMANLSFGQIFSPYSQYGLGIVHNGSSPTLSAMGGIGAAYSDPYTVNYTNPASLADLELATFDIGLRLNTRSVSNATNLPFTVADGGLNNISLSFPVMKKIWGISIGLVPYSFTKFKTSSTQTFNGRIFTSSNEGKGSLYKFYLGNGFQWKGFKAGINTEFLFGKLENNIYNSFDDDATGNGSRLMKAMSIRDIIFNAGLQYNFILVNNQDKEDIKKKTNLEMTVGAYFAPSLKVDAFVSNYLESTALNAAGEPSPTDTASGGFFNEYNTTSVPTSLGAGINIGKKNEWNIGLEYDFKSWVKFNSPINNSGLTDEWHLRAGASIIPNITSKKYLNRVTYRFGAYYGKAPYMHENTEVSDFGITFGFGIPLSRYKYSNRSLSNINIAFEIGALGTNKKQNLVENYYNLTLTYTLSDIWFRKQKFD